MKAISALVALAACVAGTDAISNYYTATFYSGTGCGGSVILTQTAPDQRCLGGRSGIKSVKIVPASGAAQHNTYRFYDKTLCGGNPSFTHVGGGCYGNGGATFFGLRQIES